MFKRMKHSLMVSMSRRMISCEQATYLLSLKQDQNLGFRRWMQLKMHLLSCHLCRRYERQVLELQQIMEHYSYSRKGSCSYKMAEADRERIKSILHKEMGGS